MDLNPKVPTFQDFRNCCRLCFERDSQLKNVFASSAESSLADKIASCLDVTISQEDFPATSICARCLSLVDQFYDFKQLCKMHDLTFQTSIRTNSIDELNELQPAEVHIKSEVPEDADESMQLVPLDISSESIKEEVDFINMTSGKDLASADDKKPGDDGQRKKRKYGQSSQDISVRLLHNGYLMKCNGIKLNGTLQWVCRNSACRLSFSTANDWKITLHMNKVHNHYPYVERKGMIHCVNSGLEERFAVSTITGKTILIWEGCEWVVCDKNKSGKRRANCKEHRAQCRKYLTVTGDFSSLEHFGDHDHQQCFILFRDDENPAESDLNPWTLFSQINPCRLPIGNDWDSNQRVKLFYKRYQYRLLDCSWSGDSRWLCDTVSCPITATMNGQGNVQSAEHNHEPLASGLFNGVYFCVVRGNMRSLKLFFNGHCYGSRDTDHWVCTMTACYAKLFVGSNYATFAEKGVHTHGAYNAVIKPLVKKPIHLTPKSPFLPPTITIEDLHENISASKTAAITDSPPSNVAQEQSPNEMTKKTTQADEPESSTRYIRMIFDGFRYTLWEIYPDGTTYWRCWGMRCNKSLHMAPTGSIYFKNESLEHQHEPQVSKVDRVTHEDGQTEKYAIFQDATLNTIMGYRNSLWHLVLGEASYIATCKDPRCDAKVKITANFSRFEHIGECGHLAGKLLLIRFAAQLVEDDDNIWELFKQNHPLRLVDGTIYTGGRHSQMFFGGYRYTLQGMSWNGNSLWRCALQKCAVKGRISEPIGTFTTSSHEHNHEKQELFQGKIWSRARQQEERYFIIITLKKTTATMYYNTYCYSLKDKERNVWTCFHSQCNASLRVEGDFEWVVDELVHSHAGTLTFVRDNESVESQECYAPTSASSRKRSLKNADDTSNYVTPLKLPNLSTASSSTSCRTRMSKDSSNSFAAASSSTSKLSPKLEAIVNTLVKVVPKNDQDSPEQNKHFYHGGYTYNRATVQADKNTRLECKRLRCPGRIILAPDQSVYPQDNHTHSKTFETVGHIQDINGQYYPYILVSGTQKRTVTYFVCDGFRYQVQTKTPDVGADVIWQCVQCEVTATVNDSYSYISLSSTHDHEPCDIIIPSDETADSNLEDNIFQLDEIIWGQHRYNNPIYVRRMKQTKWKCYRFRDCRAYVYRNQDGSFKHVDQHSHEAPIELCGEATFDPALKIKDRFAIMKNYGKFKFRHIVFQNQVYVEGDSSCWNCVRHSCNAKLVVDDVFQNFQLLGDHTHQPIMMVIKFHDEIQPFAR